MQYPPVIFTTPEEKITIPDLVIYQEGETGIQTPITDGRCPYTGKTIEEYLADKGPGFSCITFDDALDKIREAEDERYINPWVEIDQARWDEMLNVLPPIRWENVGGIEFFQISEMLTGTLTATFAWVRILGAPCKYFEATRRTSDGYTMLADQILEIL